MWKFDRELEWFEQFYPSEIDQLKNFVKNGSMPHLMFCGKKCNEKGLIAIAFAKEIAKLGGSVNLVYAGDPITKKEREEAKSFGYVSKSRIGSAAGERRTIDPFIYGRIKPLVEEGTLNNRFRILIIWDFDKLERSQDAFRRLMEDYADNCRMILIVENKSNVISPISSRCRSFYFSELSDENFEKGLEQIFPSDIEYNTSMIKDLRNISDKNFIRAVLLAQASMSRYKIINQQTARNLIRKQSNVRTIIREISRNRFGNAVQEVNRFVQHNYVEWSEFVNEFFEEMMVSSLHEKEKTILLLSMLDEEYENEDVGYYIIYFLKKLEEVCKK